MTDELPSYKNDINYYILNDHVLLMIGFCFWVEHETQSSWFDPSR